MIDFLMTYWYVTLPMCIIALFLLIWKGFLNLQEISLFGLKFGVKQNPIVDNVATYIDNPQENNPTLRSYEIVFKKAALENISFLKITQEVVITLVENEFTHHVNYFKWDLLDYPLPVQEGYIVLLDKLGTTVTFRAIKRADFNELELASVNDLLAIYRRLSRFEYRTNKSVRLKPEMVNAIIEQHKEIIKRLIRHYELFKKIVLPEREKFPSAFLEYLSESGSSDGTESKIKAYVRKLSSTSQGLGFNTTAAISALFNLDVIIANEENGLLSQDEAEKEIVLCLERSLQYIHKMINACLE